MESFTQYDYDFVKKQLQNYLNPGSVEEDQPAALPGGTDNTTPAKTDFTLDKAATGNKDTVSKFDDLFNE